jgi:molybdopterin-guanine dinucleotide biosynthesis protein A
MIVTVAVLAGGRGSRLGGEKALVELGGRPMIWYPLAAARKTGLDAVVVAKRCTRLPDLDVPVLREPDGPTHPLLGVITALEHFPAVLAVPCDMPFLDGCELAALAAMPDNFATLAPAQPFPSLYRRAALPRLRAAVGVSASVRSLLADASARAAMASGQKGAQVSVNTPEDLAAAELQLSLG